MCDDEIITSLTNGGPGYLEMDEAFCARMRTAIKAGLESAPIGVVTTNQKSQIRPSRASAASLVAA
jgi:hypothetical protein